MARKKRVLWASDEAQPPRRSGTFDDSISGAYERAGTCFAELDAASGLPLKDGCRLELSEIYEQMGAKSFYWPPFWFLFDSLVHLNKRPNARLPVHVVRRRLRSEGWTEDQITGAAPLFETPARRPAADRARREIQDFFDRVNSRAGVSKPINETRSELVAEYADVPPGQQLEWKRRRAAELGLTVRQITDMVKPSQRKATKH